MGCEAVAVPPVQYGRETDQQREANTITDSGPCPGIQALQPDEPDMQPVASPVEARSSEGLNRETRILITNY
ncbi:hypothetical protein GCM10017709_07900 [Glutamicibacter nicotianae]|uniref:Uncharacterized protein n=1 Tax=Glutamicibacter nicotianae TaxID=37929 RepID=A0ABQ0RQI3_GLUNI|nr:hypothetical protein ANI01nite_32230 [Glutamicibacter nicotianae]